MSNLIGQDSLDGSVTLLSPSSTARTIREAWRPVQQRESTSTRQTTQMKLFRRKLIALNIFGMIYYFTFCNLVFVVGLFVTGPVVYNREEQPRWIFQVLICFIYINIMLNYGCIVVYAGKVRCARKRPLLPHHGRMSYAQFCDVCQEGIPARGKHCTLCDTCILKRDHHCFFAGCCIGFHNQRYFIVFCLYVAVGSLINVWTNLQYLHVTYANLFSGEWYKYLLPWCLSRWMFSDLNGVTVCILTLTYFTIMTGLGCTLFLVQQLFLVYRGQTSYEYSKGVAMYRTFPADHFRSVFGNFWFFSFIIPMPWFRNFGDGRRWNTLKHV